MGYFPFFMDIAGKKGVIAGGGAVAARKVEKLIAFGPELTVIAPRIEEVMRIQEKLLQEDAAASLFFIEREFRMEDLRDAYFVIAATDDAALNGRIADHCKGERIPVNVVDDREKCTFFFPALCKKGALTVGISTDGKCPSAAVWARREIERTLPTKLGDAIDLVSQLRLRVMQIVQDESERKDILERMFAYCMEEERNVTAEELIRRFALEETSPVASTPRNGDRYE